MSILKGETRPDLLREETLVDIFTNTVREFPDKVALILDNSTLTYKELDDWSNAVASFLIDSGVKPGERAGVWLHRSLELHVTIIGILKAGAVYVPFDREIPIERVGNALANVGAVCCFSDSIMPGALMSLSPPPFSSIAGGQEILGLSKPEGEAYILHTSGSTGKPKGIAITHRQICHLIRAEQSIFGVTSNDKVYQGFSVSFDMWCEETWISYLVGATLWVSDAATAKAIDELSIVWNRENITVLHAVPSLLGVIEDNLGSLRIINAGGEACTPHVLSTWAKPGRKFFNSYGPTEVTVTATIARLKAGDQISIGAPLPNYGIAVVDEHLNPLPRGERGELVISGPGVSNGYVNQPNLTAEKFVAKPLALRELPGERIYKTGDAAIINADGTIDYQGRLDDQVKLRGYRIELGEIEIRLMGLNGVQTAAVALKKDKGGNDHLVAYILTEPGKGSIESTIRSQLAMQLPPYMVPELIVQLSSMPRLSSGKVDKRSLPPPEFADTLIEADYDIKIDETAPIEEKVIAILRKIFPGRDVSLNDDFFSDLGGHSLLAATFISRIRREGAMSDVSLRDVYLQRPLRKLVNTWKATPKSKQQAEHKFAPTPWWRHTACWIAQSIILPAIYGLFGLQIFLPYLTYYYVQQELGSHLYALIYSLASFCLLPGFFTVIIVITKWLVIGRIKPGKYPLWGTYYFRWWLVKTIQELMPTIFLNGTPLYPIYLRLMGAKVARTAQLSALHIGAEDLLTIGEDSSISSNAELNNAVVEDGWLKIGSINIGANAYVGSNCVLDADTRIEDWGELKDLSYMPPGTTIKEKEIWQGSPAQLKGKKNNTQLHTVLNVTRGKRILYQFYFTFLLLIFPFGILIPLFPIIVSINELDNAAPPYNFSYLVWMPLLALVYILLFGLETVIVTRLLIRNLKPGKYPAYSGTYLKKWFADQLMALSLVVIHPVFASVYVAGLFRALGAKVGKNTEISTASNVTHPLLTIGDGAFIADAVSLDQSDIRGQQLIMEHTTIGNNSFVGNSAVIPQGYKLPDDMLIGVLSFPPADKELNEAQHCKDWFGSPGIALPRRQQSEKFDPKLTISPPLPRRAARSIVEGIRIIIPETAVLCFSILFIAYAHDLLVERSIGMIVLLFPWYYLAFIGVPAFLTTVLLKWLLIGKYKRANYPMWSWQVWRSEAVTVINQALSVPFLLFYLKGTPWLPILARLTGLKIGKRVFLNTTDITEFDMVEIGDEAALNLDCGPQSHLFEDRVMKIGPLKIGRRSTIGAGAIILYDSEIGENTHLAAQSLVMKGEKIPGNTAWVGSPVRPGA